ncbi:unnamed protein product, partial [Allacma fusca]
YSNRTDGDVTSNKLGRTGV